MASPRARFTWSLCALGLALALVGAIAVGVGDVAPTPATPVPDDPRPVPPAEAAGRLESVVVDNGSVTVSGWAVDLDRPDADRVRVSIDGDFVGTFDADQTRIDVGAALGSGANHGFETTVPLAGDAPQTLCVHTAPDDDLVACTRVAGESHLGVLITERNIMVEVLEVLPGDAGYRVLTPCGNEATVADGERIRTTQILIDPGHGGSEVAAVGPNGLGEKTLNLDVAKRTADALRERGYEVELTRTRDIRIPIAVRAGLANALEPDIFLSLHHNGGALARSSVPGTQVYYQHDDTEARRLAGILYEEMFAAALRFPTAWVGNALDGVSTRLNDEGTDFYGIHRRTPEVTSIITEFLWLSNGAEAALLARDDVKDAEAVAIATGIDRWYRSTHRGSGYLAPFVDTFDSGGGGFEGCVDPAL